MYDVIIIGAGIGGLTAGALLAHDGARVLLLEGHIEPGGCASSFRRKRPDGSSYLFDVGATLFGGFQPGGAHAWVAERLGLRFPVVRLEPAMQIHLPDRAITRFSDAERWYEERCVAFPSAGERGERFWRHQEDLADIAWRFAARFPPLPPETPGDLARLARAARPELLMLLPHLGRSVADELRRCRLEDPALRSFLDAQLLISAQVPADECAWLFGSVALDLARQGVFYVEGGGLGLAHTLADAFVRDGGELRYRNRVEQILVEKGRAVGVRTAGGESIRARQVIANVTIWDLPELLGEAAPTRLWREATVAPTAWGAFTLYLGVDECAVPAGLCDHHQLVASYDEPLGEGNSAFLSLHPALDASRAPAGQRALTISTHTRIEPWWKVRRMSRAAYLERKAALTERLLSAAERVLPGLKTHIRYQQSGTPLTFQRYTRRSGGMVGGIGQRPGALLPLRLTTNPGIRAAGVAGLWLVGDSVFPGQSTAAVTQGAVRVWQAVRASLGRAALIASFR